MHGREAWLELGSHHLSHHSHLLANRRLRNNEKPDREENKEKMSPEQGNAAPADRRNWILDVGSWIFIEN